MQTRENKSVLVVTPASFTNGATASGVINVQGFDFASIDIAMSASNDVTNNPSVLTLGEGDTSTSFTNISGFVGDTDFTIPNAQTTVDKVFARLNLNTRARKKWLKVAVSPVTTQIISITANLSRAEKVPANTTEANVAVVVNG